VRAAISGETLSAPDLSSLPEAPGELGAPEVWRAGRTAEADIPEFLEKAGRAAIERYGLLSQNPPLEPPHTPGRLRSQVAGLLRPVTRE